MSTTYHTLDAYLYGRKIGRFYRDKNKAKFEYNPDWDGQPVSLGITKDNTNVDALPYLKGLLPENEHTRQEWGRDYGVNPRDPLSLLGAVGQDLPGAIQLLPEEETPNLDGKAVPLDEQDLKALMEAVAHRVGFWAARSGKKLDTPGKFSLAGAQKKTALHRLPDGKWALPFGRFPSSHILKPEIRNSFPDSDINETICLNTMNRIGIRAAKETIETVGGVRVSVIERFDRENTETGIRRIHQEDLCQVLRIDPAYKYSQEKGPDATASAKLIKAVAGEDQALEFVRQLAFNVAIVAPDAHGKNFSLLEYPDGRVELAPAYDVTSYIPYIGNLDFRPLDTVRLAMPIGRANRFEDVSPYRWERFAKTVGLNPDRVIVEARRVMESLPDALSDSLRAHRDIVSGSNVKGMVDKLRQLGAKSWIGGKRSFTLGKATTQEGKNWSSQIATSGVFSGQPSATGRSFAPSDGIASGVSGRPADVWVNAYVRKDGVKVSGHWRKRQAH